MLFHGHSEIEGRKKSKYVCLDESYKQFQETHEYAEGNGYRRNGRTQCAFDVSEDKDQAHETEDNNMPGGDVRKETDHENERLGKDPQELDKRHQRNGEFKPPGHARRIVNMFPVSFVCAEGGDHKSEQSHNTGNGQVSCYVGSERKYRDQAHQVIKKDKKENR